MQCIMAGALHPAFVYHFSYSFLQIITCFLKARQSFIIAFIKIGNVKGNGTTNSNSNYTFIDAHLSDLKATTVYYKLKQVDFNGKFEYSNTLHLTLNPGLGAINISPNPFNGVLKVNFYSPEGGKARISVIDALGRTIATDEMNAVKGENTAGFKTDNYGKGLYFIQVNYKGETSNYKMIVKE